MNNNLKFELANMDYLEDLSGGNKQLIREIIELFLKQTPNDMDLLSSYIQQADWERASKQAHHIKPTLAYVGANGMREELQQLERLSREGKELHSLKNRFDDLTPKFQILYEDLKKYLATI